MSWLPKLRSFLQWKIPGGVVRYDLNRGGFGVFWRSKRRR